MKRRSSEPAQSTELATEAATALRVAQELKEDGDNDAATRCVEHSVAQARLAASSKQPSGTLSYDEQHDYHEASEPAGLIASVGLALLGTLHREADELDAAREALEESLRIWPGNAAARYEIATLQLHHGCWRQAARFLSAVAALPPAADGATGAGEWRAELVEEPRREAVAAASYAHALLLHLTGRCAAATPLLRRLGAPVRPRRAHCPVRGLTQPCGRGLSPTTEGGPGHWRSAQQ